MREIMDAMSPAHPCTDGVFQKGTQIAGSEALYNVLGCFIDQVPCPIMLLMPTVDTAKRVSKQRLQPMIDETATLRDKVAESRSRDSGNTLHVKEFPGGLLVITGANSGPGLRSMPIRVLLMDEIDAYPSDVDGEGDPCRLAEKRTDTFAGRAKRMRTSTPKLKGSSRITRGYESGTQALYHVPCPHCKTEQPLVWEQMRWELAEGELNRVWYECASCSKEIEEHHKTWMLEHGRHVHRTPGPGEFLDQEHPHAIWVGTAEGPRLFLPRYSKPLSWHVSALYSNLGFTWWKATQEFLDAGKGGYDEETGESQMQVFCNTVKGEPYDVPGEQPKDDLLKLRAEPYRLGTRPDGALLVAAGCDVQANRLEIAVKGYGRGEESWLLDYQVLYGDPLQADVWEQLLELRAKEYGGLAITYMAVDSGFQTQTVYNWCRQYRKRGLFATKGMQMQGRPLLSRPTSVDVMRNGKVIKNGLQLWPIGTDTAKERIYKQLDATAQTDVGSRGAGLLHFPSGLPDEYFEGLVSEKLVRRQVKGVEIREWIKVKERNEPLDLEVLCYAAAVRAGVTRMNWTMREQVVAQRLERVVIPATPEPDEPVPIQTVIQSEPKPASSGRFIARPGRRR